MNSEFSSWDNFMISSWKSIIIPVSPAFPRIRKTLVDRNSIKWHPPNAPFCKLIFDGSSRGNPGDSGIGIVFRDHLGSLLALKAMPISPGTNNMAEACALLEGLAMAKDLNFKYLHIEGDSTIVINACKVRKADNWHFRYILEQIWTLDTFEHLIISHVYREGNALADCLANMGCDKTVIDSSRLGGDLMSFPNLLIIARRELRI
ncbi:hypothetical protein SUGI_1022440 [Cryptomeria japonica]|nr:hypothetical protein SUGI_1022440 [Cryptomeria japonica]